VASSEVGRRALLIGVTEYPTLPRRLQLAGPRNDVLAWLTWLASRHATHTAAQDIRVVADGVEFEGAKLPTRAAILGALDECVAHARMGDFQLVYFAGHGSQTPQPSKAAQSELDGLDEIFLPRDVGRWNGETGRVENAIIDDEIGVRLDAMRAKGTNIFAVFDCCHAATMARAAFGMRVRGVTPLDLGVPSRATSQNIPTSPMRGNSSAKVNSHESVGAQVLKKGGRIGSSAVFYAAHGHQAAMEETFPKHRTSATVDARSPLKTVVKTQWHGVFSWHLLKSLEGRQDALGNRAAMQRLAKDVVNRYASERRISQTPRFEYW
jgi:hypothetical protein